MSRIRFVFVIFPLLLLGCGLWVFIIRPLIEAGVASATREPGAMSPREFDAEFKRITGKSAGLEDYAAELRRKRDR